MDKPYPWRKTRMSPTTKGMNIISEYIKSRGATSILEFGAGYSTWMLHKLNFKNYIAVETFPIIIDRINSLNLPNFSMVQKWEDIPKQKYQYMFIDSHVGGNAGKHDRHTPLQYALKNDLLDLDVRIFFHDYAKIKMADNGKNPHKWARRYDKWFKILNKYDIILLDEVNGTEFGIYGFKNIK